MDGLTKDSRKLEQRRRRDDRAVELFRSVGIVDAVALRLLRQAIALSLIVCAVGASYVAYVVAGFRSAPIVDGRIEGLRISAPVTILRDRRDIPHIVASTSRDAFFAQGFVEGSDRLFQMELARRYAYGTLAEVLGSRALPLDESQRYEDIRDVSSAQWRSIGRTERSALEAYSDGINAAIREQPLAPEFRLLLFRPQPWRPQDSVAISLAVALALGDSWRDVLERDDVWRRQGQAAFEQRFPLSDARYDVTVDGAPARAEIALRSSRRFETTRVEKSRPRAASNAWAAGAARTVTGRALLANDPHVDLTIPGLWYLVDLRAPGLHVAGASIPGVPGVVLGHNDAIAWGATNGDAASTSIFQSGRLDSHRWMREVFHVRFARDVERQYYRTPREFGVPDAFDRDRLVIVRSAELRSDASEIGTFLGLDRAKSVREAFALLAHYRGPGENFVVADARGEIGFHLAGAIVEDPAWGRYVHGTSDLAKPLTFIPFERLPSTQPKADAVVISANNKTYDARYPYRLAPFFDPPYRAFRIAQLLHARHRYDASYFAQMQLDTVSPVDREFAHRVATFASRQNEQRLQPTVSELGNWSGAFTPASHVATLEYLLRGNIENSEPSLYAALEELRSGVVSPGLESALTGSLEYAAGAHQTWGRAGAVVVEHPLAALHFGFLNGATLPGSGDDYTIRLQEQGFSQSLRAVWDVGNWDGGGIAIPSGESGEPGSAHYTDLSAAWIEGRLEPLPFSAGCVAAATRNRLLLAP